MDKTSPPSNKGKQRDPQAPRAVLALPLLALLAYVVAMVPFAVFLARGWDVAAFVEPLAVVVVFNFLVRRYFP